MTKETFNKVFPPGMGEVKKQMKTLTEIMKTKPETKPVDLINQPPHYTSGTIEPISVIEDWSLGFCLGNVVKYVRRAGLKGDRLEDLKKARWYLDREIKKLESSSS